MIRRVLYTAATIVALAGCPSKAACPKAIATTGPAAEAAVTDVLRAVEAWRQAYEARDLAAVLALYDHGKHVAIVTQGDAVVGWDAVEAELRARLGRATDVHLKLTDLRVEPEAGAAVVVAAMAREISEGATTVADAGTLTLVLVRDGERWTVLSEHFSFRPMAR